MPSFSRRARSSRLIPLVLLAALTFAVRLPFLLRAERFFDSDEAVEGLMARHVLHGELPIFLWGQHYKGVPEVYVAALVFAAFGSSVVALKATTLACFAAFVCAQFVLVDALFSRRVAWLASGFLLLGPPSLVLWSLSANAEVVLTLLAGAVMGLGVLAWRRSGSPGALALTAAAAGFGLWVHQYILYYLIALVVALIVERPSREGLREWLRDVPGWIRIPTAIAAAVGIVYVVLGVLAFAEGGFDFAIGTVTIGVRNPQKLWRIGAALLAVAAAARVAAGALQSSTRTRRTEVVAIAAGFVTGYAPALLASFASPVRTPMGRMDLEGLRAAGQSMVASVLPIVLGFRAPSTEWLVSPWWGAVLGLVLAESCLALRRRGQTPFFHVLLITVPVVFATSGSFVDAQSYRYVMPIFGALPIVLAVGVDQMRAWSGAAATAAAIAAMGIFAAEQAAWYQRLEPDARAAASVACLDQNGTRGAFADYWLSYKTTFLVGERVIVAPISDDRYPPYSSYVRALGVSAGSEPFHSLLLQ